MSQQSSFLLQFLYMSVKVVGSVKISGDLKRSTFPSQIQVTLLYCSSKHIPYYI